MNSEEFPFASALSFQEAAETVPGWPVLEEAFIQPALPGRWMDTLWSQGWRHFGSQFFRYSVAVHDNRVVQVIPLRIDLSRWIPSKGQRRILKRNGDLEVRMQPPDLDQEHHRLFHAHCQRFRSNIPERLESFMGTDPGRRSGPQGYPCECIEVSVRLGGKLIAFSFLDVGEEAVSSVYGCFDPAEGSRSLGIATLLWEASYARERQCRYLYPGYAYIVSSPYDYKKRLGALEVFDWNHWHRWEPR